MTLTAYRALLAVQGVTWARSVWFDDAYVARLPYAALDTLYYACQFDKGVTK